MFTSAVIIVFFTVHYYKREKVREKQKLKHREREQARDSSP